MLVTDDVPRQPLEHHERTTRAVVKGGMSVGLFAGLSSVAFAIVGLAGEDVVEMGAYAAIAIGLALVVEAWALAARWHDGIHIVGRETIDAGGIVAAMLGGIACLVLGLLAVAGFAPPTLLACAAMVLGTSLVIGGPAQHDLAVLAPTASPWGRMTRELERASTRIMMTSGVVAFVLGAVAIIVLGRRPRWSRRWRAPLRSSCPPARCSRVSRDGSCARRRRALAA